MNVMKYLLVFTGLMTVAMLIAYLWPKWFACFYLATGAIHWVGTAIMWTPIAALFTLVLTLTQED